VDERLHLKLNELKWDKWALIADEKGWKNEMLRKDQRVLIALLDLKEGSSLLDMGCGTGWALGKVADVVNNKGSFYGIDISSKMIEKAMLNFENRENFHFIKASADSVPLPDGGFDIIFSSNSYHHYLYPDKVMNEIYRLLKKGGKIYILDPIADSWYLKILDKGIRLVEREHVKMYSSKEYCRLMSEAGLKYLGYHQVKRTHKIQLGEK
jgi:ubiquinone/menaquinone biosynthesis C-methylase UbiE